MLTRTLIVITAKHVLTVIMVMLMMATLRWTTRFRQASRGTGLHALYMSRKSCVVIYIYIQMKYLHTFINKHMDD